MHILPYTRGQKAVRSRPREFLEAFSRRIGSGLLPGPRSDRPNARSRYAVTRKTETSLHFVASDWSTAIAVGFNDVEVGVSDGLARYEIRYGRWAAYCVSLGAIIGLVLVAFFLFADLREYLRMHPGSSIPGLDAGQNMALAWGMAVFWGFVWPWLLIGMYRGILRRLMERIIEEVDREAEGAGRAGGAGQSVSQPRTSLPPTTALGILAIALAVAAPFLGGCAGSGPAWNASDILRASTDAPERFAVGITPGGSSEFPGAGDLCKNPLVDPRDGTPLTLVRSASGLGDYRVPAGKYGIADPVRELLRVDCGTGRPVGIVRQ